MWASTCIILSVLLIHWCMPSFIKLKFCDLSCESKSVLISGDSTALGSVSFSQTWQWEHACFSLPSLVKLYLPHLRDLFQINVLSFLLVHSLSQKGEMGKSLFAASANTAESLSHKNEIAISVWPCRRDVEAVVSLCLNVYFVTADWLVVLTSCLLSEDDLKPPPYSECAHGDEADAPRPYRHVPVISEGGDLTCVNEAPPPYTPTAPTQDSHQEGPVSHSESQSESRST